MIFKENFYVGYSDINHSIKLSNVALLRYFENIACMHGSLVGDGFNQSPAVWFLTGYHVKIHSRPDFEERLLGHTWSSAMKGFTSAREFALYREDGTLAVSALSNWARIDRASGRPVRLTDELFEQYGSEKPSGRFENAWLGRLGECENYSSVRDFYIDRNFIDANLHMNNVHYLEIANLVLPEELYVDEPNEFSIRYRKAVTYGETVKCLYGESGEGCTVAMKSEDSDELRAIVLFYK